MSQDVTIQAVLHGAARIPKMDRLSVADPYVRLRCLGSTARSQTRVDTGAPVWDETLELTVPYVADAKLAVNIELWDQDLGPDDLIGLLSLDLKTLLDSGTRSGTFELDLAAGVIPHEAGPPQLQLSISAEIVPGSSPVSTPRPPPCHCARLRLASLGGVMGWCDLG